MINKTYTKKLLLATFAALSIFSGHATSSQNQLTEEQIRELPKSLQQFIRYERYLIKDFGYAGIKAISFKKTNRSYAISTIQKNKKYNDEPMYLATVDEGTKGMASIYFRVYRDCNLTDPGMLIDKVIKVSAIRVGVEYGCARVPENENKTQQLYIIKSDEGKAFVQQEFASNPFVFVDFDDVLIPFNTDGFEEVWKDKNTPAL